MRELLPRELPFGSSVKTTEARFVLLAPPSFNHSYISNRSTLAYTKTFFMSVLDVVYLPTANAQGMHIHS